MLGTLFPFHKVILECGFFFHKATFFHRHVLSKLTTVEFNSLINVKSRNLARGLSKCKCFDFCLILRDQKEEIMDLETHQNLNFHEIFE